MNVKRFQFNSGESYSILLGDDFLPMALPNLFVTLNHRNRSDAANTCYKKFEHIKFLYEILKTLGIDIDDRCKRGHFLERHEIESIAGRARYRNGIVKEKYSIPTSDVVRKNITLKNKKESARFLHTINKNDWVSSKTCYNRLTTFSNYIEWLESFLFPLNSNCNHALFKALRPKYRERINTIDDNAVRVIDILSFKNSGSSESIHEYNDHYRTLTKDQLTLLLDAVRPDSHHNPWKRNDIRYRNQLLIHLLFSTGMRRGEIIRIKISDLGQSATTGRYYLIVRVGEDFEDKRINKPSAKTSGRRIPLHQTLYHMIEEYIIFQRSKVYYAEKTPYLLIPHYPGIIKQRCSGLSLVSVNKICHQLSLVLGFTVHPHMFRHAWNDRYSEHAESLIRSGQSTEAKVESDRRKLMGWSSASEMGARYAKKYEDERAIKTGLQLQGKDYAAGDLGENLNQAILGKMRGNGYEPTK